MNKYLLLALMGLVLIGGPLPLSAQSRFPEKALQAESEQRWDDAAAIYQEALKQDPDRADLWVRLADNQSRLGRENDAVRSLEEAARAAPDEPAVFFRLSKAYAVTQQPRKAQAACLRAMELDPENVHYLRTCARYAEWAGDLKASQEHFRRLLVHEPDNPDALLGLARAHSWAGSLDKAARNYRTYVEKRPENPDVWIEYAQVQAWRGNFPVALEILETYRERFGETERYWQEKARFLAWADRPTQATAINAPLLERHPDDYELNYTRTVSLSDKRRHREAIASLDTLKRLRPDSTETDDLARMVRTPVRSNLNLEANYYNDSDKIRITNLRLYGAYHLRPETRLLGGAQREWLRAELGTGLETVDGKKRIAYNKFWLGARHRFSPVLALEGRIGQGTIENDDEYTLYRFRADLRPRDNLRVRLERDRDLYALSPRAVSVGVKRDANRIQLWWEPSLRYFVEASAAYDDFSDDNRYQELVLAPRRAMLRTERYNLDLGVSGQWFEFDKDLDNGYYDPQDYQRYVLTAFGFWKINEDDGVSLVASAGWHKDDEMSSYKFGGDIVVEGTFGLYRDWMTKFRIDFSDRYQELGSYDGLSAQAILTRRF